MDTLSCKRFICLIVVLINLYGMSGCGIPLKRAVIHEKTYDFN